VHVEHRLKKENNLYDASRQLNPKWTSEGATLLDIIQEMDKKIITLLVETVEKHGTDEDEDPGK